LGSISSPMLTSLSFLSAQRKSATDYSPETRE
jgi:hypothetical protein